MAKIYFIKHETDFGPFFSTKKKARTYLEKDADIDEVSSEEIDEMMAGEHDYTNVIEVELDDEDVSFDG